jgi:NADH-quinone oxidoreductase subunit M
LPEAHVEAPTVGSVILAGIILKLGFYVYIRILILSFSSVLIDVIDVIFIISIVGVIIPSFFSIAQIDLKKVIAYSSVSHMNYSLIGLFSGNLIAMLGATFMMFGHAIVSSALFISIGVIYDRYKSRIIFYYSGLVLLMPIFVSMFFIFILANFGLPGTINFVGEFMIFAGSFFVNNMVIVITIVGMFLTMLYSLSLYNKITTGVLTNFFIRYFSDVTRREFYLLFTLVVITIFLGIFPSILFEYIYTNLFIIG